MTTEKNNTTPDACPAETLLRQLSGKWKPQLFRMADQGPLRFNRLLRELPGSNKQSLYTALRELEETGLLTRTVIRLKPLHVEYTLSEKGRAMLGIFSQIEAVLKFFNIKIRTAKVGFAGRSPIRYRPRPQNYWVIRRFA
jgi:DNA-binding HxlR family transcriptional regulator